MISCLVKLRVHYINLVCTLKTSLIFDMHITLKPAIVRMNRKMKVSYWILSLIGLWHWY